MDRVDIRRRGRRCFVKNVRVKLSLVYSYPRWSNIKRGSKSARKKWKKYYKQIVRHEKNHGALAKKMARNVERSIRKLTSRSSRNCSALTRKLKRSFSKINRQHDRQQSAFDKREHRRTSHIMKLARAFAHSNWTLLGRISKMVDLPDIRAWPREPDIRLEIILAKPSKFTDNLLHFQSTGATYTQ